MSSQNSSSDPRSEVRAEIAAEQRYVDTVHERLEASAEVARSLVKEGMARGHVGNEGGLVERDAMVYQASRRLSALHAAHDGLVFGRLTMLDGDSRYIGRIGVRDAEREILLIDWRAPAASLFYQATAQDPAGVVRRRVLRCSGATVVGVEDDLLDADNAPDDLAVVGEGALLASLSRARDCHDALGGGDHPEGAGRSHPRPDPWSHHDRWRARAPARPSWLCTAPPTCCTPTGAASSPAACWWSARRRCS